MCVLNKGISPHERTTIYSECMICRVTENTLLQEKADTEKVLIDVGKNHALHQSRNKFVRFLNARKKQLN